MDQLYKSTRGGPDDGAEPAQGPRESMAGLHVTSGSIMAGLPHRRPQRRSARRDRNRRAAVVVLPSTPSPSEPAPAAPGGRRAHLAAVPGGGTAVKLPPGKAASKRPRLPPPKEPAPGIAQLALDGARETMKLPLRVAEHVTRQALVTVARGLRR